MRRRDRDGERERRRSYRRQRDNTFVGKAVTKLKDSHGATETKSSSRNRRFSSHDPSIVSVPTRTSRWRSDGDRGSFDLFASVALLLALSLLRDNGRSRYALLRRQKVEFHVEAGLCRCVVTVGTRIRPPILNGDRCESLLDAWLIRSAVKTVGERNRSKDSERFRVYRKLTVCSGAACDEPNAGRQDVVEVVAAVVVAVVVAGA